MKEYKQLSADFREDTEKDWKLSLDRRAAAFMLPVPAFRTEYERYDNVCIEYYFRDTVLDQKTGAGHGLTFEYPPATVRGKSLDDEHQIKVNAARFVRDGKLIFAEQIVPALAPSEFEPFRAVFEKIIELGERLGQANVGPGMTD